MKSVNVEVKIVINEDSGNKVTISIGGHDLKDVQEWIELMEKLTLAALADRESPVVDISRFGMR